jgi:phosphate transport system ATP-binding protein
MTTPTPQTTTTTTATHAGASLFTPPTIEAKKPNQQAPTRAGTLIDVESLSAYYGSHLAVTGVTMVMEPNQVTAMIGPSGCGKSTVLRCINGMHQNIPRARAEGQIRVNGVDILGGKVDPVLVRRKIGMVFQRPNPFPTMNIYDNVVAGIRLGKRGRRTPDLDVVVERSLTQAGLWKEVKDRLKAPGAGLSGGQQQRLCIARALAVDPDVLLMDEPCSALDPISTLIVEDLIQELKLGYTIVIVTHNMQQAARVSDKTAFLTVTEAGKPGTLVEFDETAKIFSTPNQKATEDYITGKVG